MEQEGQKSEKGKMSSPLRPAILVISDTASQDPQTDKSGPALTEAFSQRSSTWTAPIVRIVPDDPQKIQDTIKEWTDNETDFFNLIVTSGGTGFAVKDITPEVSLLFCQLNRQWELTYICFI